MMVLNIPDDLAQRIEEIAEQEGATVADLLENLLIQYKPSPSKSATLADLAQNAEQTALSSENPVDTADRSREILES